MTTTHVVLMDIVGLTEEDRLHDGYADIFVESRWSGSVVDPDEYPSKQQQADPEQPVDKELIKS